MFHSTRKRSQRRQYPIHAYVGANGGGKSAAAVWDSLPSLAAGRHVLSTVRLLDFENPRDCEGCDQPGHEQPIYQRTEVPLTVTQPRAWLAEFGSYRVVGHKVHRQAHPFWVPFRDWHQLMTAQRCDVIMDEVTGVASSRESAGLPAAVANLLVQLRREDVVLRWTAPNWARADKIIRECTQAVTYCQGYLPKQVVDSEQDRAWRNRRFLRWRTYDAMDFDEFTEGKREAASPLTQSWFWLPNSAVTEAYDTFDSVMSIGTVTDAGRCYKCGGSRRNPPCKCGDDHSLPVRREAAESGGPLGSDVAAPAPGRRRHLASAAGSA